ncbi:ABC transporter permease [Prosthecomicrobium sp. N25]|uniref:ABC transporter permease n=1 Tax=Prosthecomicrobium sp. N25 TaxID=3129254 RepID=UPI003077C965
MRLLLDIAYTHVAGRLRQTLVSIAGVALGVGFSIAMAALMQGSQEDFVTQLIDAMPHVSVSDESREPPRQPAEDRFDVVEIQGLRPEDDRRGIRNPTLVMAVLKALVPGRLAPALTGQAVVRYGGGDVGLALSGVDPSAEPRVSKIAEDMREGSLEALQADQNGILVGDGVAKKLGAGLGDQIAVTSSRGLLKRFKIVGLFHTGVTSQDDASGFVNLKAAQILFERPNVINQIRIRLDDVDQARAVAARVERETGYKAVAWEEAHEGLLEAFRVRNVIMFTVVGAILLVAGFGIYNIVSTIVHEKARDIAILKSLGFAESDMRRIFLLEGLMIGVVGSVAGWLLGFGLTELLGTIKFEFKAGVTEVTHLPVARDLRHYLVAAAFALASAGVAGYLPARKAAKVKPVDIIRGAT